MSSDLRILFLFFMGIFAGLPTAFAQNTGIDKNLQEDFIKYRSQYVQEKLYVHTDKDSYLSREICWFRVYCVDAFYNSPINISKIAYIEILDRNNRPIIQQKVSLKPGEANGSMVIPANIASGTYIFRAYTAWMKNFSAEYFFEKAIRIINPKNLQHDSTITKLKRYDVQFFPEGGNLVQQIETKVAFRVTDAYGSGLDCDGMLMNQTGDTILKFHPLHMGLGNFTFTPLTGQTYKAIVRFPKGESVTKELPAVNPNGYVMNLTKNTAGQIVLSVHGSPDLDDLDVYLVIHGQHGMLPVKKGRLTSHSISFAVDPMELEEGISRFTLFAQFGQPVCERLFFKYPENKLLISAETDPEYQTRKRIEVNLSSTDHKGKPVSADMSLAVYRIDSLQGIDEMNIRNYLYLSSELGPVESPAFYFEENGKSREADMENLMLTHGWSRYIWKDVIQHKPLNIEFSPEYNGHIIRGKVINSKTGSGVPQTDAYLSIPSTRTQFRNTTSDAEGRIRFEMTGFYGSQELMVQTNPKTDSTAHIEIDNPFSQSYAGFLHPDFSIPSKNSPTLLDLSIHEQVQHVYDGARLNQTVMQWVDNNPFYVVPNEKYILDEYVRFQTMEEVLREYVHSVNVTLHKDIFQIYVYDGTVKKFFTDLPLILIDGVPFFYANELFHQDPLKIRRIDLVTSQYALGYATFPGIINLTTYHGDLDGIELDPHITVLDYPGIPEERQFFSPMYETEQQINSRMPDYRTLLYWKPQINSGLQGKKQLSFYTSDLPGNYAMVVQGLTEKGDPGSQVIFFKVKK
jgi:hypothetical protein